MIIGYFYITGLQISSKSSGQPMADSPFQMPFLLRGGIALCILLSTASPLQSQMPFLVGLESFSSGNTHGTFISPFYGYRVGNHELVSGPMLQLASGKVRGVKLRYSYAL